MEKKIVNITISGAKASFSVETRDQQNNVIKREPGMNGLRTDTVDRSLAYVINKFGGDPEYTININGQNLSDMPGSKSKSLGDRFLRWLDQYDNGQMRKKIG